MTTTIPTRWAALLSAGALTITLAACGSDDGTDAPTGGTAPTATDPAPATQEPTEQGAGADTTQEPTTDTAAGGTATSDTGGGAATGEEIPVQEFAAMLQEPGEEKLSTYEMTMTMSTTSGDMVMEGAVDMSGDTPAMTMDMEVPGAGAMQMIMAEGRVFMAMPGVTEEGTFMEIPQDQLGDLGAPLEDIDFTSQYDAWEEAATKVVLVGEEDMDGQTLRRYQVTMDGEALTAAAEEQLGDGAAATGGPAPDGDVVFDIWLDRENLLRKMVMDIDGLVTEMTADKWGEPVDITPPDEADIMSGPTG